jgi:hypothetical protein
MPEYTFTWPQPQIFPETRDAKDKPLGLVKPGDIRDLDQADHLWRETTDEDRVALTARGIEHPADGTMSPPVSNPPAPGQPEGEPVTDTAAEPEDSAPQTLPAPQPAPPAAAPTT